MKIAVYKVWTCLLQSILEVLSFYVLKALQSAQFGEAFACLCRSIGQSAACSKAYDDGTVGSVIFTLAHNSNWPRSLQQMYNASAYAICDICNLPVLPYWLLVYGCLVFDACSLQQM